MKLQFESLADFIEMEGRGGYVWSAYIIVFAALLIMLIYYLNAEKNANLILKQLENIKNDIRETNE